MARSSFSRQLSGPGFATLVLLATMFSSALASSRALKDHPAEVTPDVTRPDDAVTERKVMFDGCTADGSRYKLAVFVYELSVLAGSEPGRGPHVSDECKRNQDIVVDLHHGASYDHTYWDVPQSVDNSPHSFARYLAKLCYTVIATDHLGVGESGSPNGFTTGLAEQAQATADVLRSLRTNNNPIRKHKTEKIVMVGHSFGSIHAELVQGMNPHLADAYAATGWTNGYDAATPAAITRFLFDSLDTTTGYIRVPDFFHRAFYQGVDLVTLGTPTPHPTSWTDAMVTYDTTNMVDVITYKDGYSDLLPLLESRQSNSANDPTYVFSTRHTDQITAPVFMLCADGDVFANAAACALGAAYFPNSRSVTSFVQPNMGHVYNLHLNCVAGWEKIVDFINTNT